MAFEYGRLTEEEIELVAKASGESVKTVRKAQKVYVATAVASLNTHVNVNPEEGSNETELGDFIEDTSPTSLELAAKAEQKENIRKILHACLKPREELVIIMLYGLEDGQPKTLDAVGKKVGVTRERIRQVESKALTKIRGYFKSHGYNADSWFME